MRNRKRFGVAALAVAAPFVSGIAADSQPRECARLLVPEAVRAAEPEAFAALISRCDLAALRSPGGETPLHIAAAHAGGAKAVEAVLQAMIKAFKPFATKKSVIETEYPRMSSGDLSPYGK